MSRWIGHALFVLILAASLIANGQTAETPSGREALSAAVITVAQANGLAFAGAATVAQGTAPALAFTSKTCAAPVLVGFLSVTFEQVPLLEAANSAGRTLRFVYYDRSWQRPSRAAIFWERKSQAAMAVFGLTANVPSNYMLLVSSPPGCRVADGVDWRLVWNRRYLAGLPANAPIEPRAD